jgi:hypothetical protein
VTDIEAEPAKAASQSFKRNRSAGSRHILHIPMPDYSFIMPKVKSWRMAQEINSDDEVSCAVMCYVVHI